MIFYVFADKIYFNIINKFLFNTIIQKIYRIANIISGKLYRGVEDTFIAETKEPLL